MAKVKPDVTLCDVNNHEFCIGVECSCPCHDEEPENLRYPAPKKGRS